MVQLRREGRRSGHFRPEVERLDERSLPGSVWNQLGAGLYLALQDPLLLVAEASAVPRAGASDLYSPVVAARRPAAVTDSTNSTPSVSQPATATSSAQAQPTFASPNVDAAAPPVTLTSNFDLDNDGTTESSSTSTLTQGAMIGTTQTWTVDNAVKTGVKNGMNDAAYDFTWTVNNLKWSGKVGKAAAPMNFANPATSSFTWAGTSPVAGLGQIQFSALTAPGGAPGPFLASRWVQPPVGARAAAGVGIGGTVDQGWGGVTLTSVITGSSPYTFQYQITNGASVPISVTWAVFSNTNIAAGGGTMQTITSSQLTGGEVPAQATITWNVGTSNAFDGTIEAPYWSQTG